MALNACCALGRAWRTRLIYNAASCCVWAQTWLRKQLAQNSSVLLPTSPSLWVCCHLGAARAIANHQGASTAGEAVSLCLNLPGPKRDVLAPGWFEETAGGLSMLERHALNETRRGHNQGINQASAEKGRKCE